MGSSSGLAPQPALVSNVADLVVQLDRLRRRAGLGHGRRIGLDQLSRLTGIPRSSLHGYLVGATLPPADRLDALVVALGCTAAETHEWAQALERLEETSLEDRRGDDAWQRLPTGHAAVRGRRVRGLAACPERGAGDLTDPAGPSVLHAVVCTTWTGTYVYAEPVAASSRRGYLLPGNNWFLCQTRGGANPSLGDSVRSDIWLFTQADRTHGDWDGWGWAPATAIAGASSGPIPGVRWREPDDAAGGFEAVSSE